MLSQPSMCVTLPAVMLFRHTRAATCSPSLLLLLLLLLLPPSHLLCPYP
jgi:hypothetical protein